MAYSLCREVSGLITSVAFAPSWSPDGKTIAYLASDLDSGIVNRGLYAVSSAGGPAKQLIALNGSDSIESYTWSPDGSTIVMSYDNRAIVTLTISYGALRTIVAGGRFVFTPSWSADGRYIFYDRDRSNFEADTMGGLYRFDTVTGITRAVLVDGVHGIWPSGAARYSPDGSWLTCSLGTNARGTNEIVVLNADGTGVRQVTRLEGVALNPQWPEHSRGYLGDEH